MPIIQGERSLTLCSNLVWFLFKMYKLLTLRRSVIVFVTGAYISEMDRDIQKLKKMTCLSLTFENDSCFIQKPQKYNPKAARADFIGGTLVTRSNLFYRSFQLK